MHEHSNSVVSAVQFESNEEFQSKGLLYEGDSGFLRFRHKFIPPQGDSQANREILSTLLATPGENSSSYAEKLIDENISYRDLGSLTHEDLELLGFSKSKERDQLLKFFSQLPNQNPSLEQIYHLKEASKYNRQILNNASNHLDAMHSALAAANYKLEILPPEDVVVGEQSFASRFVLEALNELYGVTKEIEMELSEMEIIALIKKHQSNRNNRNKALKSTSLVWTACFIFGSLSSIGVLLALYFWKSKPSNFIVLPAISKF